MVQVASQKSGHLKLKIFLGVVALLVAGYFVYKYSYIYFERRKYDKATAVIQKVADDLRAQGIETTFSRGCHHNQGKFDVGALNCGVTAEYQELSKENMTRKVLGAFELTLKTNGLVKNSSLLDSNNSPLDTGSVTYTGNTNGLTCSLFYTTVESGETKNDQIGFSCGNVSKFSLF